MMPALPKGTRLPETWTQLRPHQEQYTLWNTRKKFILAAAGRGSGKTELTRRRQVRWLPLKQRGVSMPLHGYALPTFAQAKRVAWEPILSLIPKRWIRKISTSELYVETIFNSRLYVLGLDKPERAEGVQWSTFVIDESCDQPPTVFDASILPALSHNCEWTARIGVPKRHGPGASSFRRAWELARAGNDPNAVALMWPSSDIVSPEIIEDARRRLDPETFDEQYNASWLSMGGGVYYCFDEAENLSEVMYNENLPIYVGCDFNVDPMCWVLGHFIQGSLHIFDVVYRRNTNTRQCLMYLKGKYGDHESGWFFTGDASSHSRKTSADFSDYQQIHAYEGLKNKRVLFPKSNPSIASRIMTLNSAFETDDGTRRCFFNPSLRQLIDDTSGLTYKPGTRQVDESTGMDHITDALGYLTMYLLPIRVQGSQGSITSLVG